ncbi:MAG: leucine-rich repeat domain-containing protein [Bacteroidales bacterium]|nr:leucine-rich repeat domain-containing protein [Candidatus Scybalocola fimicaballi]
MSKKLLALAAMSACNFIVSAETFMNIKQKDGIVDTINVEDVKQIYYETVEHVIDQSETPLIFTAYSDYAEVSGFKEDAPDSIDIPAKVKIDGRVYNVEVIGSGAFKNYKGVSITIPESVDWIGIQAFRSCVNLTSINIPSKVKAIRDETFYHCESLKSIEFPEGLTFLGYNSLYYCTGLESIVLPSTLTKIDSYALMGCQSLTTINIPKSVTTIEEAAFSGCTSVTDFTVDPENTHFSAVDGVLYEGSTLFSYPASRTGSFTIPDSVKYLKKYSFCYTKLSSIQFPEVLESIGQYAFYKANELTNVVIPEGVETISTATFFNCINLETVELPQSLTFIGTQAFASCRKLVSITVPNSVTRLANSSFNSCSSLDLVIDNYEGGVELGDDALFGCKSVTYLR